MKQFLLRLVGNQKGVALIEFAIVFPFMFLLLFGTIELGRYVVIIQRVEHAAYSLTDIVGQYTPATASGAAGEISVTRLANEVFPQFHRIMGVYGDTAREVVIISSVIRMSNGTTRLRWQRSLNGGGVPSITSIVTGTAPQNTTRTGGTCQAAPFNAEVNTTLGTMLTGENMIVGEVSYRYRPMVASLFGVTGATQSWIGGGPFQVPEQTITRRLFLHPRNGDLLDIPPAHPITAGVCPA